MIETGEIESIEKKVSKNNKEYWLVVVNGNRHSVWDNLTVLENFKEGNIVEITYEQKGDFRNASQISLVKEEMPSMTEDCIEIESVSGPSYPGVKTGMAINNANQWLQSRAQKEQVITPEIWASIVTTHAKALLEQMEKDGL